jgi:molybdate transport system regulatory protein
MARLTLRIDLEGRGSIGPGKVRLLETIAETGSIRSAAAALRMSYKRAWTLIQDLDEIFGERVLATETGGRAGGGAKLSPVGKSIVAQYRAAEKQSASASYAALAKLQRLARSAQRRASA